MSEPATTDEKPPTGADEPAADAAAQPSEALGESASTEPSKASDAGASTEPSEGLATDDAPKKKKKKKKRADAVPKRDELDAEGRERPTFVLTFPSDPALDHAVKAFELGDYATVRLEATKLTEHPNKDVRASAEELLRRIEPDPLVKILLGMAVLLLLFVTFWAYRTHGVH